MFLLLSMSLNIAITLPKTNIAPENGWLGEDPFILDLGLFLGANGKLFVSGRVCDISFWRTLNFGP